MSEKNHYFKAFCKVSRALGSTLNSEELPALIVESALDVLRVKGARLCLFDDEAFDFVQAAHTGLSENYLPTAAQTRARSFKSCCAKAPWSPTTPLPIQGLAAMTSKGQKVSPRF